jgi:outer membrane protein
LKKSFTVSALVAGAAAMAFAQTPAPAKVAIIHVQNAILATKDGQKAQGELQQKFSPRKQQIDKLQSDIASLQDQLKKGSATMSEDAKNKLMKDIDTSQKRYQRDGEDFEAEVQQEEGRIMNDLGQKVMDVIIKYATQNGYSMVVDVSNPQTPVLWADPSVDITNEIVKLYDQAHPGGGAATSAPAPAGTAKPQSPSPAPAVPRPQPPAQTKPVIPPAGKKQ